MLDRYIFLLFRLTSYLGPYAKKKGRNILPWIHMAKDVFNFSDIPEKNLLVKHLTLYTVAFYYRAASFTRDVIWNWGYEPQAHFIMFQKRQLNADRLFEIRSTLNEIRSTAWMNLIYNL